jgi:hypothetical protein
MTARPTSDIVAENQILVNRLIDSRTELARTQDELERLDGLRPACSTCGGKTKMLEPHHFGSKSIPCPACLDGRVSFEQMAATWRRVWRYDLNAPAPLSRTIDYTLGWRDAIAHLRSVKP